MADSAQSRVIMVVDDEPAVLAFTIQVLTDHGYQVLAANNGMEAIAKSRRQEGAIALLLTDGVMEDLNGPNLAEHLLTVNPGMRVLFMSGREPQVIAHEGAFRRGFRTILKPFTVEALLDAVQLTLEEVTDTECERVDLHCLPPAGRGTAEANPEREARLTAAAGLRGFGSNRW